MLRRTAVSSRGRDLALAMMTSLALMLGGCGGVAVPPSAPTAPPPAPTPMAELPTRPPPTPPAAPCLGGRLTVGDLVAIDAAWAAGVAAATERAQRWRPDVRLVRVRVACQPLEPAFRWQGTFYSDSAQSFFLSDTGQTEPAEVDPASVLTLPLDRVSFRQLHLSLARAGYADDTPLSPTSGVTVRLNDPVDPFGPPGTPQNVVYHVAVAEQGEVRDLFVSAQGWTIHQYQGDD
jgi:hypothetical protein